MNSRPNILFIRKLFPLLFLTFCLLISGCIKNSNHIDSVDNTALSQKQSHNSANSLDWTGEYQGILPCADCADIETIITLTKEMSYVIQTKYISKSEKVF